MIKGILVAADNPLDKLYFNFQAVDSPGFDCISPKMLFILFNLIISIESLLPWPQE